MNPAPVSLTMPHDRWATICSALVRCKALHPGFFAPDEERAIANMSCELDQELIELKFALADFKRIVEGGT